MFSYITPIINLCISGTIIYYLQHLEKIACKCSLTFQRNYIYYKCNKYFFSEKIKRIISCYIAY